MDSTHISSRSTKVDFLKRVDHWLLNQLAILFLFVYIYTPQLKVFPISVSYLSIVLAFGFMAVGHNAQKFVDFIKLKPIFTLIFLFSFCIVYAVLIASVSDWPFDKTFLITYIRFLLDILLMFPFIIFLFFNQLNYKLDDFVYVLVKIGVIQGVISISMFLIPGLREFIFSYIMDAPSDKLSRELYRGFGLSGDFYFASPLFQGLTFILNSYLYIKTSKVKYILFYPFILAFMLLNSRTSLVVIPVFFAVVFSLSFYYNDLRWLRKLSGFVLIFLVVIAGIATYFYLNPEKARVIMWVIDGVLGSLSAFLGNIEESQTFSIIAREHFHFPQRLSSLWFGEGLVVFDNPMAPVKSDLGYVRYIYYGGIVLSTLFYFVIINFALHRIIHAVDPMVKAVLISLLIVTFIVHFKGDIFNSSAYLKGFFLVFMATLYNPQTHVFDAK